MDLKKTKDIELSNELFEKILDDCVKKVNRESDDDWQDIIDRYGLTISNDHLRKNCTGVFGSVNVKRYFEQKLIKDLHAKDNDYISKLEDKKRELERLKIQYRDERTAWSKQNYSAARLDSTLTLLEKNLSDIGNKIFDEFKVVENDSDVELICMISDLHIGQTFNSYFGEYNTNIAWKRLEKYLNKVIEIGKKHNAKSINVVNLADVISGSIHKTIAITNKENVIDQIKISAEYISKFCYKLSKNFSQVKYYAVTGNHERLDKKEDSLHDERYGDLVNWCVSVLLSHINNFTYLNSRNVDTGIVDINVLGKTYIGIHGDMDSTSKAGIGNLSMMLGFIPYAILRGHLHYPSMNEINGVKVVQSGSISGCGDQYSIEKRLCGKPSQTTLVCNRDGIDCIYNVEL